jgi:3-oxoadipate enol-lactonase
MYVRTRLGRWFYEERGAEKRPRAPAIILWPSLLFDGSMWKHQLPLLAELGRVVVFDPPGHGKSEVPPPFSLEDNAEALVDALGELRVDRVVMVGLSWGGMLAMRLALQHSERVAALALFDTSAEAEDRARVLKYRLFASYGRRLGLPPALVRKQITPLMFCERTRAEHPDLVERFERDVGGFPWEGLARAAKAVVIARTDVLSRMRDVRVPTLVVCGREDSATEPVHSDRLASAIPGAKLAWIEDAGHVSALEQPKAVSDVLLPFVRSQLG